MIMYRKTNICYLIIVLLIYFEFPVCSFYTTSLSIVRNELAGTSLDTLAFFAGGTFSSEVYDTVDIWNSTTQQWTNSSLSMARYGIGATSTAGLAFFAGGTDSSLQPTSRIDIFSLFNSSWTTTTLS